MGPTAAVGRLAVEAEVALHLPALLLQQHREQEPAPEPPGQPGPEPGRRGTAAGPRPRGRSRPGASARSRRAGPRPRPASGTARTYADPARPGPAPGTGRPRRPRLRGGGASVGAGLGALGEGRRMGEQAARCKAQESTSPCAPPSSPSAPCPPSCNHPHDPRIFKSPCPGRLPMDSYLLANADRVVARARAGDPDALEAALSRLRSTGLQPRPPDLPHHRRRRGRAPGDLLRGLPQHRAVPARRGASGAGSGRSRRARR